MKRVEAIIAMEKLPRVREALARNGVGDVAVDFALSKLKIGVVDASITRLVALTIELAARRW